MNLQISFTICFAVAVAMRTSLAQTADKDRSAVGYYDFNEGVGRTCYDGSKYQNHLTLFGDARFVPGIHETAIYLDGAGDFLSSEVDARGLSNLTQDFTIEFWFRPGQWITNRFLSFVSYSRNYYDQFYVGNTPDHKLYGTWCPYNSRCLDTRDNRLDWIDHEWYHITVLFESSHKRMTFYRNTIPHATIQNAFSYNPIQKVSGAALLIGRNPGENFDFHGTFDELVIYDRLLSAEEVSDRFCGFSPQNPHSVASAFYEAYKSSETDSERKEKYLSIIRDVTDILNKNEESVDRPTSGDHVEGGKVTELRAPRPEWCEHVQPFVASVLCSNAMRNFDNPSYDVLMVNI